MSGKTSIAWTDQTWNPTVGCKRVSAGCDHCYAFALHDQRHIAWKRGRFPNAPAQYHKPFSQVQLLPERLNDPLHWRKPRMVFVNSVSDLFHESIPDEFIHEVMRTIMRAPQHIFQVLTKRPDRMLGFFTTYKVYGTLSNLWLGTSVENQAAANERIPLLLLTPAAVRFLSCEPLLERVVLAVSALRAGLSLRGLDWVIVGGESGAHHRPMDIDWAREIRDQCQALDIAFFYKQGSGPRPGMHEELDGVMWREYPTVNTQK